MVQEAVIKFAGLTKKYDRLTAVDQLILTIHRGEIFGLLGPNGAGKTTTILMMLGLSEPTAGKVEVCGIDPSHPGFVNAGHRHHYDRHSSHPGGILAGFLFPAGKHCLHWRLA